jgi:hypothetical protein
MKKLLIAALLVATFATSAFAKAPTNVNYAALKNFNVEFKHASDVSWTSSADYVKATFVYDEQRMEAYYTLAGEKIGIAKGVTVDELPIKAKRAFAKKFSGYDVKESILFEGTEENAYFLSAENEKESLIVKVYDNGETSIFRKIKK